MKKIKVRENTAAYLDFDGDSLLQLKNQVNEWIETYGEEAFIDRQSAPYEDYCEYKLCVYREETDAEYERRIEITKESEYRDRQQYERLKKKVWRHLTPLPKPKERDNEDNSARQPARYKS